MSTDSPETYQKDPGIHGLRSIRGIERLEICDLDFEPLDNPAFVRWLQGFVYTVCGWPKVTTSLLPP